MVRLILATALFALPTCAALSGDEKDTIREKLFAAKVTYDKEMSESRGQVADWFDKREEAARKDGNKKVVDQLKVERKAFDEDGELPKGAPLAFAQKRDRAKKALDAAYGQAVKDYTKANKDAEAAAVDKEWKAFEIADSINLLTLVNPKVHGISGKWKREGNALILTRGDQYARLQIPYSPGDEYDLTLTGRRSEWTEGFGMGLVADGRQFHAVIDGWAGMGFRSGLNRIDGKPAHENVTAVQGELMKGSKEFVIVYSVRRRKVSVALNGKEVYAFKGDLTRLSIEEGWSVPNKKALCMHFAPQQSYQFDRAVLKPVQGKGTILK